MSLNGIGKLCTQFESLSKIGARKAVGQGITYIQGDAKGNCPANDGELRDSIFTEVYERDNNILGECYTNKSYGMYVEFGTGPKGQADHDGISPNVPISYSQSPWWIHESQIDKAVAEQYHFFKIETPDGIFYQCTGQAAQPFMYPALKNNIEEVTEIMSGYLRKDIRKI